jgi:hypothetical protein
MKARLLLSMLLALSPTLGLAQPLVEGQVTVTDDNSTLKVTISLPGFTCFSPQSEPNCQLPRTIEWTVDGRTILVYPSAPWEFIDVGHFHDDQHVGFPQIHAQGPMLGYATSQVDGSVTGGAIYTLDGGAAGGGTSRIVEKVDIHNKTATDLLVFLAGMGSKPTQASLPVPDYSGLDVTGTTTVFYQGNALNYSISDLPPFPPMMVGSVVSFSGFNPLLNQDFSIPPGAVLTMITELNVKPRVALPSPSGTRIPIATFIVDGDLATWTLGPGQEILRNGVQAAGGFGAQILWYQNAIYVLGDDNNWWLWANGTWNFVGLDPIRWTG